MKYSQVILIGTGKIACDCIEILTSYTDKIVCIEHDRHALSMLSAVCEKNGVAYRWMESKPNLKEFFSKISERTLVVSANNNFMFSKDILENLNLKIINFHNALLPRHRGRNAATWALFEMDKVTGITWHEIDSGIDTGRIIMQREIPISMDTTALQLVKRCMDEGADVFMEIIPQVLEDSYPCRTQAAIEEDRIHYSWEVPNGGLMDLRWDIEKISAFLRSLDYGRIQLMPKPSLVILGSEYQIVSYGMGKLENPSSRAVVIDGDGAVFSEGELSIGLRLRKVERL